MTSYYERTKVEHLDGTVSFQQPEDEEAQQKVAEQISKKWKCEVQSFGLFSPVDCYAIRNGRMIGLLESKARSHAYGDFPTVFLNLRKWLSLWLFSIGTGVPAIFAVKFTDRVCWVPLREIDPRKIIIGGCNELVKSVNDIEPVIEVPIKLLRTLKPHDEPEN